MEMPNITAELLCVKKRFEAGGISISDWAKLNGFKRDDVYAFLSGRTSGRRGAAHRIAVALRLKAAPDPQDSLWQPAQVNQLIPTPIERRTNEV